ncbi:MAG: hypothetical protein IJ876_04770, partial [Elusimicrobiaceae bacterium]|nr:hypothetical protein [Elusimicrobiaceae bacterium]
SAKSGKYTLEMPSYADGRICCRDIETGACNNLNKNYPLCSDLVDTSKTPDYVAGNEDCGIEIEKEKETATEPEEEECVSGTTEERSCSNNCGETGTQKNQCIGGKWQGWGACSVSDKTSCGGDEEECVDGQQKLHTPSTDCWEGCGEVYDVCVNGKWTTACQGKATSKCMPWEEPKTETVTKDGKEVTITYTCQSCQWVKTDEAANCPNGKVEIDGVCCLPGQKVKNGKCLYKYRPNRFDINVLVVCHSSSYDLVMPENPFISEEDFNNDYMGYKSRYGTYEAYKAAIIKSYSGTQGQYGGPMGKNPGTCSVMGYSYYRGGSIPWASGGSGNCDGHYAYNPWWNGGTRIQGNNVYGSDQDWCDNNCGSKESCDTKGIVSKGNPPSSCGTYHCSNGWHCDNAPGGTGVALECIRE